MHIAGNSAIDVGGASDIVIEGAVRDLGRPAIGARLEAHFEIWGE